MNYCYICITYITFNRLKWGFFYCVFAALFLLCHYAGKKVFEKVPKNHYPPINFTVYPEQAYQGCPVGGGEKIWNDTCTPNQRTTPDRPDECECSDFNMVCDPDKHLCMCKLQEVIKHILHRSRRNKTHHCKVAHYGYCKSNDDCEVRGHFCLKPHRLFLQPPRNMPNARFCLRPRESVGSTSSATKVSTVENRFPYLLLFLPVSLIFLFAGPEDTNVILIWTM